MNSEYHTMPLTEKLARLKSIQAHLQTADDEMTALCALERQLYSRRVIGEDLHAVSMRVSGWAFDIERSVEADIREAEDEA